MIRYAPAPKPSTKDEKLRPVKRPKGKRGVKPVPSDMRPDGVNYKTR